MGTVTLRGNEVKISGNLPETGSVAPDFSLTGSKLNDVTLSEFKGSKVVLNIFPSLDTAVCAASVRRFNEIAAQKENTKVLCISADLPFAHTRFCTAEGIKNVISLSEMHSKNFGEIYGVRIQDGPMAGVLARAVVVVDETGKVIYSELVKEITHEPNYDDALKHI